MRIAYVTIHIAPEIMQGGVGKKIRSHINLWRERGHEVTLFSLTPAEIPFPAEKQFPFEMRGRLLRRELSRSSALKRMLVAIREYSPDIIYLRFGLYSYPLHRIFKIAPVVLDTNSNDVDEYRTRGMFFYWMNRLTRTVTFGLASGVVSPSHELVDILVPRHDKPVCVIANGVDMNSVEVLPAPQNQHPVLTLVGTPGMSWHGVDKLIAFANRYPDITVNIVGYSEKDVDEVVPPNVNLRGFLNHAQVRAVLEQTDVACSTLAFHRNNMQEASALKVREALAYGIPVLLAFRDTDLHDVEIDTILRIPNTEANVMENAERIRQFAYDMMGRRLDIEVVAPYLDQRKKEEKRLAFFDQVLTGKELRPLSIILLGTQMAVGGAQKLLLEQALWFQSHGHKVTVVFFYDRDNLHEKWMKTHAFEIQNLQAFDKKAGGLRNLPKLLNGLIKLWRILKLGKFDAIIAFTHDSNMLGLPLAKLAGVPARVGTHLGEIRGMSAWRERLHTILVNCGVIQTLAASSSRTRDNVVQAGVNPQRVKVIYNAITPFDVQNVERDAVRKRIELQKDDVFLLAVGRLVYEKGHEFLVEAMSTVTKSNPNAVAGICGDGSLREQLTHQIERLGLKDKVKLLGSWDDLRELLAAADAFILPSRWEGLPMALLEAMMAGLPVVATSVEGVDEVVEDGVHGLLVPTESPDELAKAILQLCRNPEMRRRMGEAARRQVLESYTTDRMCEQYLDVMRQGLGEGKAE